jgi:hypothetical protein
MLLIAATFVAVSGIVYFAFMAAWLTFFTSRSASHFQRVPDSCRYQLQKKLHALSLRGLARAREVCGPPREALMQVTGSLWHDVCTKVVQVVLWCVRGG